MLTTCPCPPSTQYFPPVEAILMRCLKLSFRQGGSLVGKGGVTYHWDMSNKEGFCLLCRDVYPTLGTIEHFLLSGGCPALAEARLSMLTFFQSYMVSHPYLLPVFQSSWDVDNCSTMQLLLDCSAIPSIIRLSENKNNTVMSEMFYLTRTFIFKIYLARRRLLQSM